MPRSELAGSLPNGDSGPLYPRKRTYLASVINVCLWPKADIRWITGFNLLYLFERDAAVGYPHLLTLACRCYTNLGGIFAL